MTFGKNIVRMSINPKTSILNTTQILIYLFFFLLKNKYFILFFKKFIYLFSSRQGELESIMLSEISQAVRDKHHMISPLTGT